VLAYLSTTPEGQQERQDEMLALLNALVQSDPTHIGSYALLSRDGIDLVDTYSADIGTDKSSRDYFIKAMTDGATFVSPVRHSPDHGFSISTPVFGTDGNILGVLRVRYQISILQQILEDSNGIAGDKSFGILLDDQNIVLANGTNPTWASRTLVPLEPILYTQLSADNRLPGIGTAALSLNMPQFLDDLQSISTQNLYFAGTDSAWGEPVEIAVANSSVTNWKVAFVQAQSVTTQVIDRQNQIVVVIALVTGLLIALAGFVVANSITKPILGLASTAEQIASGDFSARASVRTNDEIGNLAASFNTMTDRLKDTLGSLERRVAERTADLDMARLLSDRRAEELQHISEISRIISSEQKLDTLLSLITRLVSDKFDYYHTGIFLIDETRQYAVLQAANSEGGQTMLARGHRLEVGHTGIVGNVAQTGKARIALDVGSDAVYFDNPYLPKTRSEMALPLNLRGITIGVLDVQSTRAGAFTDSDAKNLSILADQIAITIDNARLFGQNRQALAEVQSLYDQYLRQEWLSFNRQETQVGYFQSSMGGRPLHRTIDSDEIRLALQRGTVTVVEGQGDKSFPAIIVPVRLRGQTIGVLDIKAPTQNRHWSQDEIKLAQAVSDRLALALDNARLLIESQRQTAKEQKIGEVTAKIGASINMRNVLQTAVEELGRALPGSEVIIQFDNNGHNGKQA
jgi:GAF domain-containing protein/HAMP domain-containing protein